MPRAVSQVNKGAEQSRAKLRPNKEWKKTVAENGGEKQEEGNFFFVLFCFPNRSRGPDRTLLVNPGEIGCTELATSHMR